MNRVPQETGNMLFGWQLELEEGEKETISHHLDWRRRHIAARASHSADIGAQSSNLPFLE